MAIKVLPGFFLRAFTHDRSDFAMQQGSKLIEDHTASFPGPLPSNTSQFSPTEG